MRTYTDADGTYRVRRDDYLITPAMLNRYTAADASYRSLEETATSLAESQLYSVFGDDVIIDDVTVVGKGRNVVVYFDWHRKPEPVVAPETLTLREVHGRVRATYERDSRYRLIDVFIDENVGLESVLTLASRVDEYGAVEYVVHRASLLDRFDSIAGGYYTPSLPDALDNIRARAGVVN